MSKQIQDAYIVAAVIANLRLARPRGVFRHTRPDDMLVFATTRHYPNVHLWTKRASTMPWTGCAMPEAEQGMNVARIAVLLAGLPNVVAAVTVNRFCSSGLQAVAMAADRIRLGEADLMIGGGTESMSMVPMMGYHPVFNPRIYENEHIGIAYGMGITAEKVAEQWQVTREQQDAFAVASHAKALAGIAAGEFADEIAPYTLADHYPDLNKRSIVDDSRIIKIDDGPRAGTTLDALAKLPATVSAQATQSPREIHPWKMSRRRWRQVARQGEQAIKDYGLTPLARFVGFSVAGVPPEVMGISPKAAIRKSASRPASKQDDLDWIELNEAFAGTSAGCDQGPGPEPRQDQSAGWRDCTRSSARCHRRPYALRRS